MKIRIGKEDCKFFINKEKGVTVCVINIVDERPSLYAAHNFITELDYKGLAIWPTFKDNLHTSYVGIAKCSPEDKWDEEIGRKLAFYRAKIKFYKDFFHVFMEYIKCLEDAADKAKEVYTLVFDKVYSNLEKITDEI